MNTAFPQDNTQHILDKIQELDKRLTKQIQCDHSKAEYKFGGMDYTKSCKYCGLTLGFVTPQQKSQEQLEAARDEVKRREKALGVEDKDDRLVKILAHAKEMYAEGKSDSTDGDKYVYGGLLDTIESLENYLFKRD